MEHLTVEAVVDAILPSLAGWVAESTDAPLDGSPELRQAAHLTVATEDEPLQAALAFVGHLLDQGIDAGPADWALAEVFLHAFAALGCEIEQPGPHARTALEGLRRLAV